VRHRKNNVGLNRTAAHRKALLANLTTALVTHKKIVTTLPKARATRRYAERLITFARRGDVAARREVLKKLRSRDVVKVLFDEIGPKFKDRPGGYTRIIKMDSRAGDNADMAILELVGFATDDVAKKSRRKTSAQKASELKKEEAKKASVKQSEEAPVAEAAEVEVSAETDTGAAEEVVPETAEAAVEAAVEEAVEEAVEAPVQEAVEDKPAEEAAPEAPEASEGEAAPEGEDEKKE